MSIVLFKKGKIELRKVEGGGEETFDVEAFRSPSLVGTGDVMVVFVELRQIDTKRVVFTKYIETQGDKWARKTIKDNGKNWKAQLLLDSGREHIAFASVAKGGSVYLLSAAVHHLGSIFSNDPADYVKWDFRLSVGTITEGGNAGEKKIVWNTQDVTDRFQKDTEIRIKLWHLTVNYGFGFLMDDGTFVFVFMMTGGRNNDCFLIAYSKDLNSDFTINMDGAAQYYEIIFPWGKSFFVIPDRFYHESSEYKLRVSNDMGRTWEKYSGPLAEKLDSLEGIAFAFTPITIGKRRVLLFAGVPYIDEFYNSRYKDLCNKSPVVDNDYCCDEFLEEDGYPPYEGPIKLFMFDDEHFKKVGSFFCDDRAENGGNFLYTNDELFFLYHRGPYKTTLFFRLKEQLKKIKRLLKEWYTGDEEHTTGPAGLVAEVSENLTELAVTKTSRKGRQ